MYLSQFTKFVHRQISTLSPEAKEFLLEEAADHAEQRLVRQADGGEDIILTSEDEIVRMLSFALWIHLESKASAE